MFDEEVDRLVAMSDEDFVRAIEQLEPPAFDSEGGRDVLARVRRAARSREAPPGGERGRRGGTVRRIAYTAVAAAMAAMVVGLLVERQAVVLWLQGRDRT
ncbi:MAG: hypothetical protein ACRENE_07570, partial [Polyangiaceae bacterium]